MAAEFDFIEWVKSQQVARNRVPTPIGDDLAVLHWDKTDLLLVGVDQVLDGVHFDSSVHSPRAIGRKAMNRNLSDCAAMACLPAAAVTTFALPSGVGVYYAKEIYAGMKEAGEAFDCPIVGGDTGAWAGKLVVTVTILGRSAGVKPVTRSGAENGDNIYVTGALGGSRSGRHMTFEPRISLARRLAQEHSITSMIDLSDGLSRDLAHICRESKVRAILEPQKLPLHDDAMELEDDGVSALDHALHDGEDYELLFTSPDRISSTLATEIGVIALGNPGTVWVTNEKSCERLSPKGWEHQL